MIVKGNMGRVVWKGFRRVRVGGSCSLTLARESRLL